MTSQANSRHATRVADLKAAASASAAASVTANARAATLQRALTGGARVPAEADQKFIAGMWDAVGWLSIAADKLRERLEVAEAMIAKPGATSH